MACREKYPDLTGKIFDDVTVMGFHSKDGSGSNKWYCVCKCGKEKYITTGDLNRGSRTKCYNGKKAKVPRKTKKRLEFGKAAFNVVFKKYKKSAMLKEMAFEFTEDEFRHITSQDCYYCGEPPSSKHINSYKKPESEYYIYNGIDRTDNNIGYIKENCVPCCRQCNMMKRAYPVDEFLARISRIYNKLIKNVL